MSVHILIPYPSQILYTNRQDATGRSTKLPSIDGQMPFGERSLIVGFILTRGRLSGLPWVIVGRPNDLKRETCRTMEKINIWG